MGKVVKGGFGQREDLVYGCVECGGQEFYLTETGFVRCSQCGFRQFPPIEWIELLNEKVGQSGE